MIKIWMEEEWKQQGWEGTQEEWEDRTDAVVKIWAEKQWNEERKNMVKLRMYRRVKKEKGWTGYLEDEDIVGRSLMGMLRAGTSWLRIEKGREKGLRRVERVCRVCGKEVEDEDHFLRRCAGYVKERKECEEEMKRNMNWTEENLEKAWWGESKIKKVNSALTRYVKRVVAKRDRILGLNIFKNIKRHVMYTF
jgi:hypothetical protein